jgi:hypothetical protein
MLIEFDTVRSSSKESFEKQKLTEVAPSSVPFENENDYVSTIVVDMNTVIDFVGARIYLNSEYKECVYCRTSGDEALPNILINSSDFKRVFEYAKGIKIIRHEEI